MIEGKTPGGGARDNLVRRGVALVASLLVVLLGLWLTIGSPAHARPTAGPTGDASTTSSVVLPTTSSPPSTTPTTQPTTTQPPQTTASTAPPPTEEEPPPDTEPEEEEEDEEPTETTAAEPDAGISPLDTSENLLVKGNGIPGSESAQAPPEEEKTESSGSSDEDRVIWMIIAGLGAVALLVALLTWRYWLLTRPGIDLSDDDPDDGGYNGGGGYYDGGPPVPSGDPFGAPAPRVADVNPMTTGMPPASAATGWQDPAGPPRQGPARPPRGRAPERGAGPEPIRRRPPRGPEGDPFPQQGPPPASAPPRRGRSGRGRRGGGDPFWDDVGDQPPRRQPPDQGRRRPDPGGLDPW